MCVCVYYCVSTDFFRLFAVTFSLIKELTEDLSRYLALQHLFPLVFYLPGVAVHLRGLIRLVRDAIVNTRTGLCLNAASITVVHHTRWTHTARDAPCGHLEKRSQ